MASAILRRSDGSSMQWMVIGTRAIVSRAFVYVSVGAGIVDILGSLFCSKAHAPSYKNNIDKLQAKGIDFVICVVVNDPYVKDWAKKLEANDCTTSM
ncbi:putative peroxiredoxin-B [Macadamia integrifolia]|uniref:putative peroxiredoxin-B n=1 Tax=Macadamia integrifolia TaxID=60698 RepID=UPI001C4E98EE|nr:putative peroxiredoxin-B [Macadamia integrifolia]